nr:MAG TPA: hypothetical protein [Caudoviricetes sp.]
MPAVLAHRRHSRSACPEWTQYRPASVLYHLRTRLSKCIYKEVSTWQKRKNARTA